MQVNGKEKKLRDQIDRIMREQGLLSRRATVRYRDALYDFAAFLARRTNLEKLANLRTWHLRLYAEDMERRGLSPATRQLNVTAIRFAHDMLTVMGRVRQRELPTASELGLPRRRVVPDRAWTPGEVREVIARLRSDGEDRLADGLVLGWELGLRIHELFRLDRAQAEPHSLARDTLRIKGKGGKIREVPLTGPARAALERLRKGVPRGEKLLLRPGERSHEAMRRLRSKIRALRPDPGPGRSPLTFHGLRYAFARRWVRALQKAGTPVRLARWATSVLLGHNREEITDLYTRATPPRGGLRPPDVRATPLALRIVAMASRSAGANQTG